MTQYHLTRISNNAKTGRIPVSTTSSDTCPDSCPLKSAGCYAKSGPLGLHWQAVTSNKRGSSFESFLESIRRLPRGQLWRHNQAGDLMGLNETIDKVALERLVNANRGKRGFTYTHKPMNAENMAAIKAANANGFTINLSANSLSHADQLKALDVGPVAAIIPSNSPKVFRTSGGHKVVTCPAQTSDRVTCESCKLCSLANREYIIGFLPHGTGKKHAEELTTRGD